MCRRITQCYGEQGWADYTISSPLYKGHTKLGAVWLGYIGEMIETTSRDTQWWHDEWPAYSVSSLKMSVRNCFIWRSVGWLNHIGLVVKRSGNTIHSHVRWTSWLSLMIKSISLVMVTCRRYLLTFVICVTVLKWCVCWDKWRWQHQRSEHSHYQGSSG